MILRPASSRPRRPRRRTDVIDVDERTWDNFLWFDRLTARSGATAGFEMHAILLSVGTDGDVYPYIGLGATLRARGHRVTILSGEEYGDLAREHGLSFETLVSRRESHELLGNPRVWQPLAGAFLAARWGSKLLERHHEILAGLERGDDPVIVASPGVLPARLVAETDAIPMASVILQPWMIPSSLAPPAMPGGFTLPRGTPRPLGKLYWSLVHATGDWLLGRPLNRLRRSLGLRPVRRVFEWWLSRDLVIGMFPDWYGPPQTDWPPRVRLAGFPMYDGRPAGEVSAGTLEFCRASEPPIVFTFGTGMLHAGHIFRAAVEACRVLTRRGLLLTRHREQLAATLPPFMRHAGFEPFQRLFPLCAAVVHHGGVGTTAKALAAGIPQLVVPLGFDQPDNARRLKRLGVGDWVAPGRASGPRLAGRLTPLLSAATTARCREVAAGFGETDGLETAAGWVEELAARTS